MNRFVFLAAALLPTTAAADTFWDIPAEAYATLEAQLERGDVLVRMCPGCGGEAVMVELRALSIAPGDYSDGHQVTMRWRGIATGPVGAELTVPALACTTPQDLCLQGKSHDCAGTVAHLDVPYTFVRRGAEWVWVGALAGLNPPGPSWSQPLPVTRQHRKVIRTCKRLRSGPAFDWGEQPPRRHGPSKRPARL